MSSDNQLSYGLASTTPRGLVDRVKGFFQRKDRVDEGGLRLLFDQDQEETGPLALYSPNPSTVELGVVHADLHGSRRNNSLRYCLSAVWFNRRRIWSIIGVLSLLFVASVSIKVFFWDRDTLPLTSAPALPEYSTSLGCLDASYTSQPTTLKGPIFSDGRHTIGITGGVVGTLSILGTESNATEVEYEVKLATTDEGLLRAISYRLSSGETSTMNMDSIQFSPPDPSCSQRYDITVRIPPTVRHLDITTEGTTHVMFDRTTAALPKLDTLTVNLRSPDHKNMILTHRGIRAEALSFTMGGGLLSGNMLLAQNMTLRQSGYAWMLVDAVSANDPSLASVPTVLRTETGVGRSHVTYRHFSGAAHRQIDSVHKAAGGQLEIDYGAADFEGSVEVTAGRVRANGALRGAVADGARVKNKKMWVGRQEGTDQVIVESTKGYATLLF